ncbi:hypothetical protein HPP92_011208 [Vanilla planifolia]|uniref:poly(A)-specific ribonuclease n=1 Tax=Vanilla planifolia TaxID=51239 RepID=A0A835R2D7_VANPL|nr:hypothetical protein HPP92_011208 [Vanilla planifolia]
MANSIEEKEDVIPSAPRSVIDVRKLPFAAIDSEYPGVIWPCSLHEYPKRRYAIVKANVDSLQLVQFGLTLSNGRGGDAITWEFTLRDFSPRLHPHNNDSVEMLKRAGLDFNTSRHEGIPASFLAGLLVDCGLVRLPQEEAAGYVNLELIDPPPVLSPREVSWITFQGEYDFAFLLKLVQERWKKPMTVPKCLTERREEFLSEVRSVFGEKIYDIKQMSLSQGGLHGGLERMAAQLEVVRPYGMAHQAGPDSLLSSRVFFRLIEKGFPVEHHRGKIFGLV